MTRTGAFLPTCTGAVVIDACAAPGNKTSHVAGLVGLADKASKSDGSKLPGRVHAFERDPKREGMLRQQMRKFKANDKVKTPVMTHGFLAAFFSSISLWEKLFVIPLQVLLSADIEH